MLKEGVFLASEQRKKHQSGDLNMNGMIGELSLGAFAN